MGKRAHKVAPLHIVQPDPEILRIDIGCGKTKEEGWLGVDAIDFGQKYVADIRKGLPFGDDTVDQVRSSHFVEHLTGAERIAFFNDLYRVMKPGAQAQIITPHWSNACAYGDPTHQWPPMSDWYPLYLHKDWRAANAPHVAYICDFGAMHGDQWVTATIAGTWDQRLQGRNPEHLQTAMQQQINACRDLIVTFHKRPLSPK